MSCRRIPLAVGWPCYDPERWDPTPRELTAARPAPIDCDACGEPFVADSERAGQTTCGWCVAFGRVRLARAP